MACVHLPHVAIALEERDNVALVGCPLVIEAPEPGPRTVYDVSYAAHLAGVKRGMGLAQARKVCPEVTVLPARVEAYQETFRVLLELLAAFTDDVEPADLERSWLAATGLTAMGRLERTLAKEMTERVRRELGLSSRVGIAHGKLTSKIVTQYLRARNVMVLPPGKEVAFLGGLATRYLPLSPPNLARLLQLGLTKIHQYAALPSQGLLARFGYEGLRAYKLAHGNDDARVVAWQSEPLLQAEHLFQEPLANEYSLRCCVGQLAQRIARPLAQQFQMAGALQLTITFEDGTSTTQQRTLVEPVVSPRVLLTHADALMSRITWRAPVERVSLAAQGLCPTTGRQLALFRRKHEVRQGVEATMRRLQAKHGLKAVQQGHLLEHGAPLHERRAYLAPWEAP